ncbi:MAG: metallophosphoesterase family protein [Labilithrix sp.]|nr:metallophosphoesterase family protein [Labilithrix sp.]MCW5813174.1 metallophosphoesterase family protein [Labilithrix sp.]
MKDRRRQTVPVSNGAVKVAVIADTHSEPHPRAAELVAAEEPDLILHAGDIGALSVVDDFAKIAPTVAVRGNIDAHALPDAVTLDFVDGDAKLFTLLLLHIAVNGPKLRADAARLAKSEHAQLVVCGHSHVPFIGRDKDLGVFNPGSIGPRRFHLPIVFGVMELAAGRLAMKHVSCETGKTWLP